MPPAPIRVTTQGKVVPSRYLRETYLTSSRINAIDSDARDFWVRLLLVVDDHGRFLGDPQLIASRCFPLKPDAKRVERLLKDLEHVDLVERYEVDGKKFVVLTQWQERIRSQSKYPAPAQTRAEQKNIPESNGHRPASSNGHDLLHDLASADSCAQLPASAGSCKPRANTRTFSIPIPITPIASNKITFDAEIGWLGIGESHRANWRVAYPDVDLDGQLARARVWVLSNPKKAGKRRNWAQFLSHWLSKAQDDAPAKWDGATERRWQ